jgi:sugar phosphate permease
MSENGRDQRLQPPAPTRVHYAWVVALVTFLTMLVSAGIRSTPGVLMVPLTHAFGWTRETVSVAIAVNLALYGLIGPFSAALMERFGIRRVTTVALACLAAGAGLTALMRAPWQFDLLWGFVVGTGTGFTASVLGATVATRWFHRQRGLVIGLLTASNASGQLIFLPLLAKVATSVGWQAASLTTAAAALALTPVVFLLLRDDPREKGLLPYGASAPDEGAAAAPRENALRAPLDALAGAVRQRNFWLLTGSFMICGLSTSGLISNHLIPALMDHGYSEVRAAGLVAMLGVFDVVGTTTSGWLSDRHDGRWLLCWYYGLRGLALLFLPFAMASEGGLAVFIVFYGLDWVATVPPTVRLTNESFGGRGPVVYGWVWAAHQIGSATAAFGAGLVYTWLRSYAPAFWAAGALCLMAAGMVLGIRGTRRGRRGEVGALRPGRVAVAGAGGR